jgi:aromatic ring-cleaving dioxygenase
MRDSGEITGFHAHIYYGTKCGWFTKPDPARREIAANLQNFLIMYEAKNPNTIRVGSMHDQPCGPHTQPMFEVEIETSAYAEIFKFLILNNKGLSILFHPVTGNEIDDHTILATWLGQKLPLDLDKL